MITLKDDLNRENILSKITDRQIFDYYCINSRKKKFSSEFRDDPKPSCTIFQFPNGNCIYKDFGGESYDCIAYVMKKYSLSYKDTLIKINKDFNLNLGDVSYSPGFNKSIKSNINKELFKSNTSINVVYRDWEKRDTDYWYGRYYIENELFTYYNNYPISEYLILKEDYYTTIKPLDIAYTSNFYIDNTGLLRRKIYRPYSEFKWTSNITSLVVPGYKHLVKSGDILIITKSMKDLLVLKTIDFNLNVISTNNETSFIPDGVLNKLKLRFKRVFINFDNDETGINFSNKLAAQYNLKQIFTNDYDYKDPSDYIEKYGPKILKELIDENTNNR